MYLEMIIGENLDKMTRHDKLSETMSNNLINPLPCTVAF